mgnify:CR=1 FL=1|jgi:hypothetical protein
MHLTIDELITNYENLFNIFVNKKYASIFNIKSHVIAAIKVYL